MFSLIKGYGDDNPERFSDELIYLKRDDNVLMYMNDIASALEVVTGITFLGGSINTDESQLKTRGTDNEKYIPIEESRLDAITLKFKIEGMHDKKMKEEIIEKTFLFPKLVNNHYFILNGSRYYPIFQIIDSSTYHTATRLTLKTLLMPIVLQKVPMSFVSNDGEEYVGKCLQLDLFKHKTNVFSYYFAKFGATETLKYFGFSDEEMQFTYLQGNEELEGWSFFVLKSDGLSLAVRTDLLEGHVLDIVTCIVQIFGGINVKHENIDDLEFWGKKLGSIFTKNTNNQTEKGEKILISFERILDNRTKTVLRVCDEDKSDSFSMCRYMIRNFDKLCKMDNMSLVNKRLRVNEYLLHPLLIKFSQSTYRLLNSKQITFNALKSIFKTISPGFIVKKLIQNELLRYHNAVNGIDLFTAAMKFSSRGPQSLSDGGKTVSMKYRGLHPSYMGRLSLTATSASDPGLTGVMVPFMKTDGFYFTSAEDGFDVCDDTEEGELE
jgi:hypothetical protein